MYSVHGGEVAVMAAMIADSQGFAAGRGDTGL
jgi:hypothetical protein